MVVLNGWYLYRGQRLCQVVKLFTTHPMVYWADVDALGYALERHLIPLPEGLTPLLLSSKPNLQGELNE
jgi:hypothetical protein